MQNIRKVIKTEYATPVSDQLVELRLPDGIKSISSAFASNGYVNKIIIPESVTVLSEGAFDKAYVLESVALGGVKHIGSEAFSNCVLLKSVELTSNIESIGELAFAKCENIMNFIRILSLTTDIKHGIIMS